MNIFSSSSFVPGSIAAVEESITSRVIVAVTEGTEVVMNLAKELVAVDTGELQASGYMTVTLSGQNVIGSVIFDAGHSAYVEFGTGIRGAASEGAGPGPYNPSWPGMPSQPFLRPALDSSWPNIFLAFKEAGFET